jgi:Insertion element 4 transposase N-terminal
LRTESATTTLANAVTVAAGVFAPGHLGELTRYLPFELVDDVLEETRTVQRRLRALPSRTGVYFVLALGLFPGLGSCRGKLTAGLAGMDVPRPSEKALRDLRRRLGPAPLKALFEVVAGPLAWPSAPGVRFAGLRTVAFDGCNSVKIPDTVRNFTSALEAAREELTAARGVCPDGPPDLPGVIGRAVLSTLLPARRARFSARKVKCATSRYLNRDDGRPRAVTAITAIDITVRTPPPGTGRPRRYTPAKPRPPQPPTRRQLITAIITSQPPRNWSGHELAMLLQVKPRSMFTQLREWALLSASSHAPASASTGSTRRPAQHPRQPRPTLNYAALRRDGFASLDRAPTRKDPAPARKTGGDQDGHTIQDCWHRR